MAGLRDAIYINQAPTPSPQDIFGAPSDPEATQRAAIAGTGDFGRGLASAALGALAGTQRFLGARDAAEQTAQEASQWTPEINNYQQVDGVGTGLRYALGKFGGALPYIPVGIAGAGIGRAAIGGALGGEIGGAAAFVPSMTGDQLMEMDRNPAAAGMSEGAKWARALPTGAAQAAIGAAVPAAMAGRLLTRQAAPALRSLPGAVLEGGAQSAAGMGAASAGMDIVGQVSRQGYDPSHQFDYDALKEAAIGGAVGMAPIGVAHSAVAHGLDYVNAGGGLVKTGGALAVGGAKAVGSMAAKVPGAVKAELDSYGITGEAKDAADGATDLFATSAAFQAQHPELAQLNTPPVIPPGTKDVPTLNALEDSYNADQTAAAKSMAARIMGDDSASNEDRNAAQAMLETDDPTGWKTFKTGVVARQKTEQVANALGRAASQMSGWVQDKFADASEYAKGRLDLAGVTKSNLEQTPQDIEYANALRPALHAAVPALADSPEITHAAASVLKDFVLSRFGDHDEDGVVDVPHSLIEAFGDNTPKVVAKAYDTLRRQGLTEAFDKDAPALLKEVNAVVTERKPLYDSAVKAVSDNLTPTALDTVHANALPELAGTIAHYLDRGKHDDAFEAQLDDLFGANKDKVLSQVDKLHEPFRGTMKYGKEDGGEGRPSTSDVNGKEDNGDYAPENPWESPTQDLADAAPNYHFMNDKLKTPFDMEDAFLATNLKRVQDGLDSSRLKTRRNKETGKDEVMADHIGVVEHANDTGEFDALKKLREAHPDLSDEVLNERFRVLRTQDSLPDMSEPIEVKPWELKQPVTSKGVVNPRSWQDVTEIKNPLKNGKYAGKRDVSTIADGRIYLTRKSEDVDVDNPHYTGEFVTSAQKLISKMLERKTAGAFDEHTKDMTGAPQKLAMFAAGLTSLLDSGKFHDEIKVKMPDGEMKVVNGLKDLPDDFVLYRGKDFKVTVKDALGTTDAATRKAAQKEVWKDMATGKEVMPAAPSEKFEASDIPNMTRDELRGEYAAAKTSLGDVEAKLAKLPKDESAEAERDKLKGIRGGLLARMGAFEEAGNKRVGNRAPGEQKEQAVQSRTEIVGRETDAGIGDIGFKTETRSEHLTETEEMGASKKDGVRNFEEETGIELHPREKIGAVGREKVYNRQVESLRQQYAVLQARGKELTGLRTERKNAVLEGNIAAVRREMDEIVKKSTALQEKIKPLREQREAMEAAGQAKENPDASPAQDKAAEAPIEAGGKYNKERTSLDERLPDQNADPIELIHHLIGKDVDAAFASPGALKGSASWTRDPVTHKAIIRIAANALDPMGKAYHESMHEFFQRLLDDKRGHAAEVLQRVADGKLVLRHMMRTFAHEPEVLSQLGNDPAERVAYMFQLWAADKLNVGPETATVFRKMLNMVRKVLGFMTADQKAVEIMDQFSRGNMSDRGAMARVLDTQEARGTYLRKVGGIVAPILNRGSEWVGFAENQLTGNKNPALDWIGRQFNNKTGSQGDKQGFLSAEVQMNNKHMNMFADALRGGDKVDVDLALEGLQKKEWHADPIVRGIQDKVAAAFKEMYGYMEQAGVQRFDDATNKWVPIQKIDDYRIPVSWDASKIIANAEGFKNLLLEHHSAELEGIAKAANEEVASGEHAGEFTASWTKLMNPDGKPVTAENIADAILKRLISTNGQAEFKETENALGFSPFMKSVNERTLHWIDQKVFHEFQEKDMAKIISTYVGQATKRAEYSRRFGPDGGKLQAKMEEAWHHEIDQIMKEKYGTENAVKAAMERRNALVHLKRVAGQDHKDVPPWEELLPGADGEAGRAVTLDAMKKLEPARRAIMALEGTLGHDISPLARKANAYSIVYQNMRLLGYAMFSNLIDPLGIMVRGGEFKDSYAAFKRGMRDVVREWGDLTGLREAKESDRDEATKVAEMIGTVDSAGFMSTMGNMYGSQYLGQKARDMNDKFFRWNGMEAFNKAMRVQATQAAISFIKRHYEGPNDHSERYFKELNLDRGDVKIDKDGRLNVDNPAVQQAVMRWVDGAQLRPNAAIRPTMASDPHYATFYHLKQFMYAMQAVILKRVQVEIKNGNTDPLMLMMSGYIPMMIASDAAKGLLQAATGGGAPIWEHDGVAGIVAHGAQRAGLLGIAQMGVDAATYGPMELGGPMVEQVASATTQPLSKTLGEALMVGPLNMALKGMAWND